METLQYFSLTVKSHSRSEEWRSYSLSSLSVFVYVSSSIHSSSLPSFAAGWIMGGSAHSPRFPSLHQRHSSFSNPSVALPTSWLILQPFRCFTYVTAHSPTLLPLLLCHRIFTYVTWRAARGVDQVQSFQLAGVEPMDAPEMMVALFLLLLDG